MKFRLLSAALAISLSLWGCADSAGGGGSTASGSVAMSRDDALVYAVDADLDTLFIVDAKTSLVTGQVKVGRTPEKVLVAPDDTIYVTNRFGRSVSVVRRGEQEQSATLPVGVEPVGLAISTDGRTLYVVNSTALTDLSVGTVMAFDTATRELKWETAVGPEPRAITLLGGGKAAVTLYKSGDLVLLDVNKGVVTKASTDVFRELNRSALASNTTNTGGGFPGGGFKGEQQTNTIRRPRAMEAITTNQDGTQVYVAALLSSDATLNTRPSENTGGGNFNGNFNGGFGGGSASGFPLGNESGSGYGASTSCGKGPSAVAAPAVLTFDSNGEPQVDDLGLCFTEAQDRPPLHLESNVATEPVQGPAAIAVDPTGGFLFIANRESNNVSIIPSSSNRGNSANGSSLTTSSFTPSVSSFRGSSSADQQVVRVGAGPTGVTVSGDGATAWVYNAFDHSLSKLASIAGQVREIQVVKLANDVLPADVVAGRKLFFSATDARMNNPALGISCASCHVEAREDGHIWNTTEGPRNTPTLIGKKLDRTAPFHWNGEFDTVSQFMSHTTRDRMGGTGPDTVMEKQLLAFILSVPTPDNPFTTATPADVLARGKAAFDKAACSSCHVGEALTDNKFYDVGTYVSSGPVPDQTQFLFHGGLNTPSLLGIARTAPFLHDGSAPTLKARILIGKDRNKHGKTSALTSDEVDDLVAYVQSL